MSWFSKAKAKTDKTTFERGKAFSALDNYYTKIKTSKGDDWGEWIDPYVILDEFRREKWKHCEPAEFIPMLLIYIRRRGGKVKREGKGIYVNAWGDELRDRSRGADTSGLHVPRDIRKVTPLPKDARIDAALAKWGV